MATCNYSNLHTNLPIFFKYRTTDNYINELSNHGIEVFSKISDSTLELLKKLHDDVYIFSMSFRCPGSNSPDLMPEDIKYNIDQLDGYVNYIMKNANKDTIVAVMETFI